MSSSVRMSSVTSVLAMSYKKWLAVVGFLLILASSWLYPVNPKDDWSDQKWEHHLAGSKWVFSRHDGTVLANKLTLSFFGEVSGYNNPNERRWVVKNHELNLLGEDGRITSRFPLGATSSAVGLQLIQPPELGQHELKQQGDQKKTLLVICLMMGFALLAMSFRRMPAFATRLQSYSRTWLAKANGRTMAFLVLLVWFILACTLASTPAHMPDEVSFLVEALASGQRALIDQAWFVQLIFHQNTYGYGGVWWSIYTGITLILSGFFDFLQSPDTLKIVKASGVFSEFLEYSTPTLATPMVMMRFLALLSLTAFGALLVRHARTAAAAMLCAVVLITLPIAWWSGKLASPELFSATSFAAGVLYWFVLRKVIPALLLTSLAVAIKLTIAPAFLILLVFVIWDLLRDQNRSLPRLALYGLLPLMVFLLGNLWLLHSPQAGIEQLISLSRTFHASSDWQAQADRLLFLNTATWDLTNYGSLTYWSGGLVLIPASLIVALFINRRLGLFLFAGGGAIFVFADSALARMVLVSANFSCPGALQPVAYGHRFDPCCDPAFQPLAI